MLALQATLASTHHQQIVHISIGHYIINALSMYHQHIVYLNGEWRRPHAFHDSAYMCKHFCLRIVFIPHLNNAGMHNILFPLYSTLHPLYSATSNVATMTTVTNKEKNNVIHISFESITHK
jgi:hypothetical protein